MAGILARLLAYLVLVTLNTALAWWFCDDVPLLTDLSFGQWFSIILTVWTTYFLIDIYCEFETENRG